MEIDRFSRFKNFEKNFSDFTVPKIFPLGYIQNTSLKIKKLDYVNNQIPSKQNLGIMQS